MTGELDQQRNFLGTATAETQGARTGAAATQLSAAEAARAVQSAEAQIEAARRAALGAMNRANAAQNEIGQAKAALDGFEREQQRLEGESAIARGELEALGQQRGQIQLSFENVGERLKRLESEIVDLRHALEQKRLAETQSRRAGDQLRAEHATLTGRRSSLEALIREHSYSTDTVRNLFRANARRDVSKSGGLAPAGTLADFLEVEGKYENVVDEFLRDELNYIVVKSWDAADEGMRLLQSDVTGRATFLVHPNDAPGRVRRSPKACAPPRSRSKDRRGPPLKRLRSRAERLRPFARGHPAQAARRLRHARLREQHGRSPSPIRRRSFCPLRARHFITSP